mmetsp:Transcript_62331/g.115695  ORF Transcript_62331/g.115695 Transcript_62331/m.115695 type:complete len:472 (+) Transcript_62331:79-1494(+)
MSSWSSKNDPFLTNASAPQNTVPPATSGYSTFQQPSTRGSPVPSAGPSYSQGSPQGSYGQPLPQAYPQGPYDQPPQQALLPLRPVGPGDVGVAQDPFMAHARPGTAALVDNDPFLTHDRRFFGKRVHGSSSLGGFGSSVTAAACCAPCAEVVQEIEVLMGGSHPDATPWCGYMYVFVPYSVFLLTLLLLLVVQHFSRIIAMVLLGAVVLSACVLIAFGLTGTVRGGPLSWIVLGCLCLLAFGMGLAAGHVAWNTGGVRQSWWFSRGKHYSHIAAGTDARSVIDAAAINFDDESKVDTQSSAGYTAGGDTFCVAPVLDDTAETSLKRVQFWAVGLDCCDGVGGFKCDESRQASAHEGVVMLDGGNPCPGCNAYSFQQAISKAEAVHNLVGSDDALLVRWVSDSGRFKSWLIARVCLFLLTICWLAFFALAVLGHFANQFGWGRSSSLASMWGLEHDPYDHHGIVSHKQHGHI